MLQFNEIFFPVGTGIAQIRWNVNGRVREDA